MTDYTGLTDPSTTLTKDVTVTFNSIAVTIYTPSAPAYTPPAPLPPPTGLGSAGAGYVRYLTAPYDVSVYSTLQQQYGDVAYVGGSYWVRIS